MNRKMIPLPLLLLTFAISTTFSHATMATETTKLISLDTIENSSIIASLPKRIFAKKTELDNLRKQQQEQPDNAEIAAQLVQRYIDIARDESEPRYLGYAQGILQNWDSIEVKKIPAKLLLLRATINQHQHRFNSALMDLNTLLQRHPNNGQAWLTKASILQSMGKHRQSISSCYQLAHYSDALISSACLSSALDAAGKSQQAFLMLGKALKNMNKDTDKKIQQWVYTLMGNYTSRIDNAFVKDNTSEAFYQQAIAIKIRNPYLLNSYSSYLIETNQPQKAIKVLGYKANDNIKNHPENRKQDESLLFNLALAYRNMGDEKRSLYFQKTLKRRLLTAEREDNLIHKQAAAKFALYFENEPYKALTIASKNWQTQKSHEDKDILIKTQQAVEKLKKSTGEIAL